jgi:hypothetical protein
MIDECIVAIVGSRSFDDYTMLEWTLDEWIETGIIPRPSLVISGGARGADRLGQRWAEAHQIPVQIYRADWTKGRAAGFERNSMIVTEADYIVAFWDGVSRGTFDTIKKARERGKFIRIMRV